MGRVVPERKIDEKGSTREEIDEKDGTREEI